MSKRPLSKQELDEEHLISLLTSSDDDMEVIEESKPHPSRDPANTPASTSQTGKISHYFQRSEPPKPKKLKSESSDIEIESIKNSEPPRMAQPAQPAQSAAKSKNAEDILASIPSVDLPDPSTMSKPNFRTRLEDVPLSQDGLDVDAAPDCLLGLTFVITGQLPNIAREDIQNLIKKLGGHVTSSLSKRTTCMIMGSDAGPSKIQKAKSLNLKVIDEQGFLDFIKKLPANGGNGKAAELARAKRQKEEARIAKEVEALKARELQEQKQRQQRQQRNNQDNNQHNSNQHQNVKELWTTKYAPKQLSDICGNNAAVTRLHNWLKNWESSRKGRKSEGSEFKAAILSGPPGIGKTTAAHMIGKLCGYDIIEYNASDTRSKSLLNSQVAQTLSNRTLTTQNVTQKLLVIMDEVDGMGAGDRGGVGAMAALAKSTNVPLIMICNERSLPKMRPFDRCTFDILFRRPDASQVRTRLMTIARAEGLTLDAGVVEQLVAATRSDIRQMLNLMENFRTTKTTMSTNKDSKFASSWNKEIILKPFDITSKLLNRSSYNSMSVNERMDLYFHDYDFAPLMIQENYLLSSPNIKATAEAAESFSEADLVDQKIHQQQQWGLMPLHALMTCVIPPFYASGQIRGRMNFTAYLGNNSKGMKYKRLLSEIKSHMRLRLSASSTDLRLEFQPLLSSLLLNPLLKRGQEAIPDVIEFMDQYYLTKEDWDVIMELGVGPNSAEKLAKGVPTPVKTAFTRKYNQMSHPLPFMRSIDSKAAAVTGRKMDTPDNENVILDDVSVDDDAKDTNQEADSLETAMKNDKYISKPKPKAKPRAKTTKTTTAKSRAKK